MEALVVGINYYPKYTEELHPLTAAAEDAESIATQLEEFGYQKVRVQRLPRQEGNQKGEWQIAPDEGVKIAELQEAIENLLNPPDGNPAETALFFFSGHGWRKNVQGKDEVLLATSDVLPSKSIYGLPISWLGNLIQNSPVKKLIVWLDCCYSGKLIEYLPTNKDYCIFTATRSYEPGFEIKYREGLFTQALKEGLNPAKDPDGWIDSHKLAKYIQNRMAQTGQAPQCSYSDRSIILTSKFARKAFQDECPYRSLSYFTEQPKDAQVFYGRTELTQDLIKRVRDKEALIAVFGASGSGKSSLLRAGLLYQLKLGQEIAGSNNWVYCEPFTPTDDPLARLGEVSEKIGLPLVLPSQGYRIHTSPDRSQNTASSPPSPPTLGGIGVESPPELGDLGGKNLINRNTETRGGWGDRPIILIIDQFEECFTMCDEEKRKAFIDCLTELIETIPNLQLIIGMRSDFRGRLREYPLFTGDISKVNVGHLNREEIQEAIEKPADFVGLGIEGSLKQQLINDVEDYPGSLPLLQYTLTELWNEARKQGEQFLRLETYQTLGRIEGTLEKRADAVYESLPEEEQTVAKRIFLELTQVGDTFDVRRRVRLGDLVNSHHSLEILDTVTQKLASDKNRLITRTAIDEEISQVSENYPQSEIRYPQSKIQNPKSKIIIDVVHEALIRHWKLLGDWKQKYQNGMVIERRIEELAQEWEKGGRKKQELYPASKLGIVEGYLKEFGEWGMLDGMAEEFITESRKHKKVVRRNWIFGGTTIILSLLAAAIISASFAVSSQSQKEEAEHQKGIAESKTAEAKKQKAEAEHQKGIAESKTAEAQIQTSIANNRLKNTIGVLIKNSQELFDSNTGKEFDALLTSLKAARLQQSAVEKNPDTKLLKEALQDAVFWVKERNRLEGNKGAVNSISFSPDGRLLASGSTDGTIKLWEVTTGKVIKTLDGNKIKVNSVSFSKDGLLASGSDDKTIKLWNVSTGKEKILDRNKGEVNSVSFSPDGRLLASGSGNWVNGTIKLRDLTTGKTKMVEAHWAGVNKYSFSPDGRILAFIGVDQTIKLWDVTTDDKITSVASGAYGSVSFSKDGRWLAYSDENRTIHVWDVAKKKIIYDLIGHKDGILSLSFSPNGQILASSGGSSDKTIKLWDVATGQEIKTLTGHKLGVRKVSFSPNGNLLASASEDGTIKLWDMVPHKEVIPLNVDNVGDGISLSPDGKLLASTTKYENKIKLWDVATHKEIATLTGHTHWLRSVSFSRDGNLLASAAWDGTIRLWDVRACIKDNTCEASQIFPWNSVLASVSFSPNGKLLASTSWDGTIALWDVRACTKAINHEASQTCLFQRMSKKGHSGVVQGVSFSRDGKLLASGSGDKTIKIWDVAKGKEIKTLTGHSDEVRGVSFSPDGKQLASASNDQTIKLWDVATGKNIKTLTGHTGSVIRVIFSPDGKGLVSGSDDKTIKLWDVATGKAINTLKGHRDIIVNFSLSDDGQVLASNSQTWGDSKGEIILWNLKIFSNLTLDDLIGKGCDWVRGYLENNPNVTESDRHLCDDVKK